MTIGKFLPLAAAPLGFLLALAPAQDAPVVPSDGALAEFPEPLDAKAFGIGGLVPDLAFTDLDGAPGRLSDFADRDALVIVVREVGCPVSQRYGLRTAEIERESAARNVAFLYVNVGDSDSVEECRAEVATYGFGGRYARDVDRVFGWHLQVRTTTDVFVLDSERKLRFRGPIDDQIGRGATKPEVTKPYLKDAIGAVLEGRRVAEPALTAPGCFKRFVDEPAAQPASTELTWHGRISRLVQQRCQDCHRKGGPAPFTLMDLDDVTGARTMIRQVVIDRVMPPWYASVDSHTFRNDISLRPDERADLLRWLQAGCPEGDPAEAPPPREFKSGWLIGEPDLIVEIPEAVEIPADGVVDYMNVMTPTGLTEDVWVQAMQVLPEHPEITHHVLAHAVYVEDRRMEFIDSYLPGKGPTIYDEGSAYLLEKGAHVRFNLHYTPKGIPCVERTKIGFKFAKEPPKLRVWGKILRTRAIDIAPGEEHFEVKCEREMVFNAEVIKLIPHMHLRGKAVKVEFAYPDGTVQTVLDMPRWHPDWQFAYELDPPIKVPKGTVIYCTNVYDNSANNPFNPDPKQRVKNGPQIWDEMGGVFVEWKRRADAKESREESQAGENGDAGAEDGFGGTRKLGDRRNKGRQDGAGKSGGANGSGGDGDGDRD